MFIDIKKLKSDKLSTGHYNVTINLPKLTAGQEEVVFDEAIKVETDATFTQESVLVDGKIIARAQVICHCCLEQFILDIKTPLKEKFVTTAQYNLLTEKEQQEDNINTYQNDKINLLPLIEQALYLALPMKSVCKEGCKGLCPKCGCNLNLNKCGCKIEEVDPRLAVLQQLLKN